MAVFTFLASLNGTFAGTAGDDTFIWPGANGSIDANDTFFGGAGNDTLRLDSAVGLSFTGAAAAQWMAGIERITVNNTGAGNAISIGALAGAPEGGVLTMLGGVGNDVLDISARGAGYNGVFDGAGGNDRFLGGGGDDLFRPGTGADTFAGGGGNDTIEFSQSSLLFTQPFEGTDSLNGGSGIDTLRISGDAAAGVTLTINLFQQIQRFEIIDLRAYTGPTVTHLFSFYESDSALGLPIGSVTVLGGAGDDRVDTDTNDILTFVEAFEGGAGDDYYRTLGGAALFRPGSGGDTLNGGGANDTVEMALADLDLLDSFATDPASTDVIRFTSGGILWWGQAERFTGFERLELGPDGVAIMLQGLPRLAPEDRVAGDTGYLPVFGGEGKDRINANEFFGGPLRIEGGGNNDTIIGTDRRVMDGVDEVSADTLRGQDGNDLIFGGQGRDVIEGGAGDDTIDGGGGDDRGLSGGAGNDRILGGAGNDWIEFDASEIGQDSVFGGAGNDTIDVGAIAPIGDDLFSGGSGTDELDMTSYSGAPLVISAAMAERLSGFEWISASWYVDTTIFVTDSLAETAETPLYISSFPLDPVRLLVDASAVSKAGIRIMHFDSDPTPAGSTADTLIGGGGADTISRESGADLVMGGDGDDLIFTPFPTVSTDPARLDGGAGVDTLRTFDAVNSPGFSFAQLSGFEIIQLADDVPNAITFAAGGLPAGGGVQFRGGNDSDVLDATALATAVHLSGRAGDDMLLGGSAADWLDAGTGTDLVMGGAGNDTIRFTDAQADDMVDGGAGLDRLVMDLDGKRFGPAALANLTGFESLEVSLDGGRLVLSQDFVAPVGSGVFLLDLVTTAGGPGATMEGAQATARLDIRGSDGAEMITGGRGADAIRDGAGADRLQGFLGADLIALSADGAVDRVIYGSAGVGSRDIAVSTNPGLLGEADTITGFNGVGDGGNLLEILRGGFLGLDAKSSILGLSAGAALDLSAAAVFLVHAADVVAGGFANRSGINTAFGNRVLAGDAGQGAVIVARGPGGTDAGVYFLRERDGLAGISNDDQLYLLAVMTAPGAITASEISLI